MAGIPTAMIQNQIYALPSVACVVDSQSALEYSSSIDGPWIPSVLSVLSSDSTNSPETQAATTIERVQATPTRLASGVTSASVTFNTAPRVGDGIVIGVVTSAGDTWTTGASDTFGNTYTVSKLQGPGIGTGCSAILVCNKVITTGTPFTITVTSSVAADLMIIAVEVNGELAIDRSIGGAVNSTTPTINTATLTNNTAFVMQVISIWAAQTSITATAANPASPAWNEESEKLTGVVAGEIDTRILSGMSGVLTSCNWTLNPGGWCDYVLVAYQVTNLTEGGSGNKKNKNPHKFVRSPTSGNMIICKSKKFYG